MIVFTLLKLLPLLIIRYVRAKTLDTTSTKTGDEYRVPWTGQSCWVHPCIPTGVFPPQIRKVTAVAQELFLWLFIGMRASARSQRLLNHGEQDTTEESHELIDRTMRDVGAEKVG